MRRSVGCEQPSRVDPPPWRVWARGRALLRRRPPCVHLAAVAGRIYDNHTHEHTEWFSVGVIRLDYFVPLPGA